MKLSRKQIEQFTPRALLSEEELAELVNLRLALRLKALALAVQLGVNDRTFNNYERGIRHPPVEFVARWRAALSAELQQAA